MKQGTTLLIVFFMMLVFGTIIFVQIDTWEKRIKKEVLAIAAQSCHDASVSESQ